MGGGVGFFFFKRIKNNEFENKKLIEKRIFRGPVTGVATWQAPGGDWAVLRLGVVGEVSRLVVDTNHFKGNFPESVSVDACLAPDAPSSVRRR